MNKENFENLMITVATLGFLISKVAAIYIAYLALKNNIAYSGWLLLVVSLYVLLGFQFLSSPLKREAKSNF